MIFAYRGRVVEIPEELFPQSILDEWERTIKAERERMYRNLKAKLSDEDAYINLLVMGAIEGYEGFVNPDFPYAEVIKAKRRAVMPKTYSAWKKAIERALGPGGYYDLMIELKKDRMKRMRLTLSVVGYRPDPAVRLRAGAKAPLMFEHFPNWEWHMIPEIDEVQGSPQILTRREYRRVFLPLVIPLLVEFLVLSIYAKRGGYFDISRNLCEKANSHLYEITRTVLDAEKTIPETAGIAVAYGAEEDSIEAWAPAPGELDYLALGGSRLP